MYTNLIMIFGEIASAVYKKGYARECMVKYKTCMHARG